MQTTQERSISSGNGYAALAICAGLALAGIATIVSGAGGEQAHEGIILGGVLMIAAAALGMAGLYMVQPNQAAVLQLFGAYKGTVRDSGLRWSNPLYTKQRVSLRANNLNMERLKVNDKRGNPIEIAAAVVWKIQDTARAIFDVEDYQTFVRVQAEAALRHVATHFNYDSGLADDQSELTLMSGGDKLLQTLVQTLQSRIEAAGIEIREARLTHLAYAPEIAASMLRRQQAEAVIAARHKIVEGAVSMVEMALKGLSDKQLVSLDDDRKAAMVSNLLVVLCADREVEPVVNTGTLYP
ncbi:MAG TPA: SPFH domain-containing protein [Paucimonas sp.]|nr:SPFH domain-containing protein [Paucimonas sp.]